MSRVRRRWGWAVEAEVPKVFLEAKKVLHIL